MQNQPLTKNAPVLNNMPSPIPEPLKAHKKLYLVVALSIVLMGILGVTGWWYFAKKTTNNNNTSSITVENRSFAVNQTNDEQSSPASNNNTNFNIETIEAGGAGSEFSLDTKNAIKAFSRPTPLTTWNPVVSTRDFNNQTPATPEQAMADCVDPIDKTKSASADMFCAEQMTKGFRNPKYCENIPLPKKDAIENPSPQVALDSCFSGFVRMYNPYDCSIHENSAYRDRCYSALASTSIAGNYATYDCSKILDPDIKSSCEYSVSYDKQADAEEKQITLGQEELNTFLCALQDDESLLQKAPAGHIRDILDLFVKEKIKVPTTINKPCASLTAQDRSSVINLASIDQDDDGLPKLFEDIYTTDDTKKDTDGDTFGDLSEINTGHAPTGEKGETLEAGNDSLALTYIIYSCMQKEGKTAAECSN